MRKIVNIICIVWISIYMVIMCVSCENEKTQNKIPYDTEVVSLTTKDGHTKSEFYIYKFEYDNHKYILMSFGHGKGLTHDPDCDCFKNDTITH